MSIPATMRALQQASLNGPKDMRLITDAPVPSPGEREILIRVAAARDEHLRVRGHLRGELDGHGTGPVDFRDGEVRRHVDHQRDSAGWLGPSSKCARRNARLRARKVGMHSDTIGPLPPRARSAFQ